MRKVILGLAGACLLAACEPAPATAPDTGSVVAEPAAAEPEAVAAIDIAPTNAALASAPTRSDEDKARDAGRKPADVLNYLGLKPGDTAADFIASGGWYTEVLSIAVGPEGQVYAQNSKAALDLRDGEYDKAMTARLEGDRLPNVIRKDDELQALTIPPGSVDIAITALNFHDVYNAYGPEAATGFLAAIRGNLKPGGVLGVIDHAGSPDGDNVALHRIDPALAVATAEAAGFEVEINTSLLASASDDHTKNVFDPAVRGQTDRFILKLTNPG